MIQCDRCGNTFALLQGGRTVIWKAIPDDVIRWFRDAFAEANRKVAECLLNVPNAREATLDDTFITALIPRSAPTQLASGALVRMDIHNIGGLRRIQRWEVADIGIVVFVSRAKRVIARKLALLQTKRLYPANNAVEDDDPGGYFYGFNALIMQDPSPISMTLERRFDFSSRCVYGAIKAGSAQVDAIEEFSQQRGHQLNYLLYNPHKIPVSIRYPISNRQMVRRQSSAGSRVVPASALHSLLANIPKGSAPTYEQVRQHAGDQYWRIEHWAADLLLTCQAGLEIHDTDEQFVLSVITRRSGPIGAAIALHIELPGD